MFFVASEGRVEARYPIGWRVIGYGKTKERTLVTQLKE